MKPGQSTKKVIEELFNNQEITLKPIKVTIDPELAKKLNEGFKSIIDTKVTENTLHNHIADINRQSEEFKQNLRQTFISSLNSTQNNYFHAEEDDDEPANGRELQA